MGAGILLNGQSMLGKNGWPAKRFCDRLLKKIRQANFIAFDAHDAAACPPLLGECWWTRYFSQRQAVEMEPDLLELFNI